jgi:rhamnose transport system ATP-binding protein
MGMSVSEFILELKGITKIFPGVKALSQVNFNLAKGEIHALMGENGAGKSTFIKVITGVHSPEEGEVYFEGHKVNFKNTRESQKLGIAAIYQHVTNYPDLSVTENIFIGHEKVSPVTKRILWNDMHKRAKELLDSVGADIDPKVQMGTLSVAEQQIVEIAKALSMDAKVIIMDEPTAALTKTESEQLYKIAEQLRDCGVSIILISHRFEDMYRLASRVTVFRDAQYIGCWGVNEITNEKLIYAMVGREMTQLFPPKENKIGKEVLKVEGLSQTGYFADVSFNVRQGEILAFTGLVGAGRTEVFESIFGITKPDRGKIYFEGKEVTIKEPLDAMNMGIGYLPEDRQKQGLVLQWGIGQNITLATLKDISKAGWLDHKKEADVAKTLAEKVTVKAVSIFDTADSLSGGNQQKVVVAKLLASDLKVIILDEPTKGVDVGAKYAIYEIMRELAKQNYAIIMVSSEMPEVLGMSDRIAVMRDGRITATLEADGITQEKILEFAMLEKK